MAFDPRNLSALAYANGFTLWHYRTSDTMADVSANGYFNPAASMLRVGDFVIANAGIGVVPTHGLLVVRGNSGGIVDLSDVTPVGSTNAN
jgi:outer membrane protein assembly factor BamB